MTRSPPSSSKSDGSGSPSKRTRPYGSSSSTGSSSLAASSASRRRRSLGERRAGRVLEGRDRVEERGGRPVERALELVDVEALVVDRDLARARPPRRRGSCAAGRRSAARRAPRPRPLSASSTKWKRLQRAVRDEHAVRLDAECRSASHCPQRRVAERAAVGEHDLAVALERAFAQSASSATGRHSGAGMPRANEIVVHARQCRRHARPDAAPAVEAPAEAAAFAISFELARSSCRSSPVADERAVVDRVAPVVRHRRCSTSNSYDVVASRRPALAVRWKTAAEEIVHELPASEPRPDRSRTRHRVRDLLGPDAVEPAGVGRVERRPLPAAGVRSPG